MRKFWSMIFGLFFRKKVKQLTVPSETFSIEDVFLASITEEEERIKANEIELKLKEEARKKATQDAKDEALRQMERYFRIAFDHLGKELARNPDAITYISLYDNNITTNDQTWQLFAEKFSALLTSKNIQHRVSSMDYQAVFYVERESLLDYRNRCEQNKKPKRQSVSLNPPYR